MENTRRLADPSRDGSDEEKPLGDDVKNLEFTAPEDFQNCYTSTPSRLRAEFEGIPYYALLLFCDCSRHLEVVGTGVGLVVAARNPTDEGLGISLMDVFEDTSGIDEHLKEEVDRAAGRLPVTYAHIHNRNARWVPHERF